MSERPFTEKLGRFASQIALPKKSDREIQFPDRYKLLADSTGGELVKRSAGCYCLIRTTFPFGHTHGELALDRVKDDFCLSLAAFDANKNVIEIPTSSMVFLDTETTGLGGSGAVAFLIGLGRITKNGFEISQYLIPDYSDEAAQLEDVYEALGNNSTIVSFNGASFDLPVVLDRLIINRVARKLEYQWHLDLLHSSRRLFKRRLSDCTLINLERQLFSFYRSDDIPGYLVPSVYFEWLSSQELTRMNSVLEHNRFDILSLYFLALLIAEAYQSQGSTLEHAEDLYSLSRFFERRSETEKVEKVFERVSEMGRGVSSDAALHFARNFKRRQKYDRSVEIWKSIASEKDKQGYWACIELAKYFEHQLKDYRSALEYTGRASELELLAPEQATALEKRVGRLSRKLKLADD